MNLVRAFKEAVSNWLDLGLFVVGGKVEIKQAAIFAQVVKFTKV